MYLKIGEGQSLCYLHISIAHKLGPEFIKQTATNSERLINIRNMTEKQNNPYFSDVHLKVNPAVSRQQHQSFAQILKYDICLS